jgi:hypothetical protein
MARGGYKNDKNALELSNEARRRMWVMTAFELQILSFVLF